MKKLFLLLTLSPFRSHPAPQEAALQTLIPILQRQEITGIRVQEEILQPLQADTLTTPSTIILTPSVPFQNMDA